MLLIYSRNNTFCVLSNEPYFSLNFSKSILYANIRKSLSCLLYSVITLFIEVSLSIFLPVRDSTTIYLQFNLSDGLLNVFSNNLYIEAFSLYSGISVLKKSKPLKLLLISRIKLYFSRRSVDLFILLYSSNTASINLLAFSSETNFFFCNN